MRTRPLLAGFGTGLAMTLGWKARTTLRSWLVPLDPEYRPVRRAKRINGIVDAKLRTTDGPAPLRLVTDEDVDWTQGQEAA